MQITIIRLLLFCCWIFIAFICGLLLYLTFKPSDKKNEEVAVCGNVYMYDKALNNYNGNTFDGKALFQQHCASCHNPIKDVTGPALVHLLDYRSSEWICKFLTDESYHPTDSRSATLYATYQANCLKFPQLSCDEVNSILQYTAVYLH